MFHVSKNDIITLTRGDTASFTLTLDTGNPLEPQEFIMEEGDIVKFRVMYPNCRFENSIIKKQYTIEDLSPIDDTIKITIDSEDTINLNPGLYYYEIKLFYTRIDDSGVETNFVDTIVERNKFYIIE